MKIRVNNAIYSREAITATLYELSGGFYVSQETAEDTPTFTVIAITPKEGELPNNIEKELLNKLNDYQLRCDLENRFGYIRNQIVEEAFKPISK